MAMTLKNSSFPGTMPEQARPGRRKTGRSWVLAAMLGVVVLAGCASTVPAQITTFNRQDAGSQGWAGRRFVVEPLPAQRDSLEYASYAQRIRTALQKHGLVPVDGVEPAELLVHFEYGSSGAAPASGDSGVRSSVSFGVGGGFRTGWGLGIGIPVGGSSAGDTLYRHQLQVQISRLKQGARGRQAGERVYESTIVTQGESASITPQMPGMIDALLADFPGENGKTRTVRFPRSSRDD